MNGNEMNMNELAFRDRKNVAERAIDFNQRMLFTWRMNDQKEKM